jgi:hypothetical protein
LTGQRVGQIASRAARELLAQAGSNRDFPSDTKDTEKS